VDPEGEFGDDEVAKLHKDVTQRGLKLLVFADWYDVGVMESIGFFDDNTQSWWTPATGGANVPALNDLLAPFGASFGSGAVSGLVEVPGRPGLRMGMQSGTFIGSMPEGSHVLAAKGLTSPGERIKLGSKQPVTVDVPLPVLGVKEYMDDGMLALAGDSNSLAASHQ